MDSTVSFCYSPRKQTLFGYILTEQTAGDN